MLAGRGVLLHTGGFAWQVSTGLPGYPDLRVHLTGWEDNRAVSLAYRLAWWRLDVSFGLAQARRTNRDLTRHGNFYLEGGYWLTDRLRCQLVHYSSTDDDNGENLLLCGLRFVL